MGCSAGDSQCQSNENPRHEVTISRSFEFGKNEVTQGQWVKVMGNNPSYFKCDDRLPVEEVSWNDAQAFIAKLNALNDGYRYRLPTEAEWEYAARAGTTGPYYDNLDGIAWYDSNSGNRTHPEGQKQPNAYGLYDMLGNVEEWCSDWYGYYDSSPAAVPKGPPSGQSRVLRGGSFYDYDDSRHTRVSSRDRNIIDYRALELAFVCAGRSFDPLTLFPFLGGTAPRPIARPDRGVVVLMVSVDEEDYLVPLYLKKKPASATVLLPRPRQPIARPCCFLPFFSSGNHRGL